MVKMDAGAIYETYLQSLLSITEQIGKEEVSQDAIAQQERSSVAEIENRYMQISEELDAARQTVQKQYRSVWESCTQNAGLRRPQEQRPAATNLTWKEAVHIQEQAAFKIRDWFTLRTQEAFLERQRKVQAEEARRAAEEKAQAEAARRKKEEEARAEKERGEALIEAMKRKHRRDY